jgi:hypothetical protein
MTARRVLISICLVFVLTPCLKAQNGYFGDTKVTHGRNFTFHIFSRRAGDPVSRKINQLLQLAELYSLSKDEQSKHIFDQAKANDGSIYGGKTSMDTEVYTNNSRVLSIGIVEASDGATTHYWNKYYNFNSGNGDRIELTDLFTLSGYKEFFNDVVKLRRLKFEREVKKKVEPQYQADYLETASCFETDDLKDFYVRNGKIFIDGDGCLIKGQKFDGLNMVVAFSSNYFKKHLNDYGKSLFGFSDSDVSKFRSTSLPQLFEGMVDSKYKFVMVLENEIDDEYWGMYAYLKYGEGIALRGSLKEGELKLTEYVLSPVSVDGPMGRIRRPVEMGNVSGYMGDGTFSGFWMDKNNLQRRSLFAAQQ